MFLNTILWQPYTSLLFWCRKGKRTTHQMASAYFTFASWPGFQCMWQYNANVNKIGHSQTCSVYSYIVWHQNFILMSFICAPNTAVNPCTNSNCSSLCLLSATLPGHTCTCPDGQELLEDQKTCQGIPVTNVSNGSHSCMLCWFFTLTCMLICSAIPTFCWLSLHIQNEPWWYPTSNRPICTVC